MCDRLLWEGGEAVDKLDAITFLYLSKNWDGQGTLLDYANKYQQTRDELAKLLNPDTFNEALDRGDYGM